MLEKHRWKIVLLMTLVILFGWYALGRDSGQQAPVASKPDSSSSETIADASPLVSSIQPVNQADLGIMSGALVPAGQPMTTAATEQLSERLLQSTQLIESGEGDRAIRALQSMVAEYPLAPEPYINLASIYSSRGQLDEARRILLDGIRADRRSAVLFDSLQSVHGAQAAQAYQKALNQAESADRTLDLPIISELQTTEADRRAYDQSQQQTANNLLEGWVNDWQFADIERHAARYTAGFSPSESGLSHQQWLNQRQQQLSQEACGQSSATNVQIDDLDSQFSVTFSHRCRSNGSDQSIDRKLLFKKSGNDWSTAKIIDETMISR